MNSRKQPASQNSLPAFLSQTPRKFGVRAGITVFPVGDAHEANILAEELLSFFVTSATMLYLSGGSTPKELYTNLAQKEQLRPGAVGLIDERFGEVLHAESNETMIAHTGLLRYFSIIGIPFYKVLKAESITDTAAAYDELVRSLITVYPQSIGLLGIGTDGHTAGIAPNRSDFINPLFANTYDMYGWFADTTGPFGNRVTMTFLGLQMLDVLIILALGKEKQEAINQMFTTGSESEIPARFFLRREIAPKTLLLTDCAIG